MTVWQTIDRNLGGSVHEGQDLFLEPSALVADDQCGPMLELEFVQGC